MRVGTFRVLVRSGTICSCMEAVTRFSIWATSSFSRCCCCFTMYCARRCSRSLKPPADEDEEAWAWASVPSAGAAPGEPADAAAAGAVAWPVCEKHNRLVSSCVRLRTFGFCSRVT
jgi:hypothetical protein